LRSQGARHITTPLIAALGRTDAYAVREESSIMIMTRKLRRIALTVHIICSVGMLGAIAAFLVLAIASLAGQDSQVIRAAYLAMALIAQTVIVPLAIASLLTGLIQSLATSWGLFRHYWVLAKFLLTAFVTVVLLAKMELITYGAKLAGEEVVRADLRAIGFELMIHSAAGLLVLLVPVVLSVYKPRGLTSYGRRKQQEQQGSSEEPQRAALVSNVGVPLSAESGSVSVSLRYSHLVGIGVTVLITHFVVLHFVGIGLGGH
jgi:hypothetical protein